MSLTVKLSCPEHPSYDGVFPQTGECEYCEIIRDAREGIAEILPTPRAERAPEDAVVESII